MPIPGKKVLFVIPPYFDIASYLGRHLKARAPIFALPTGVLSLAAYVKANSKREIGIEVLDLNRHAFDLCGTTDRLDAALGELIDDRMRRFAPDVVGISALFDTCYNHLDPVAAACKRVAARTLVVLGGGLGTNLYREILRAIPAIDAICFGEGEIPLRQLVDAENPDELFTSSPAWITRRSLEGGRVPRAQHVVNLDEIPFLDHGLLNLDDYKGREADKLSVKKGLRQLSISTSRGCPFNCVFCASSTVHGKAVRCMSVERVLSDVERMMRDHGIGVLAIEDDHFLAHRKRAKEILRRLAALHLRIEFPNGMAIYAIDDELGQLLRAAGVTTVSLAMESGSKYVLKSIIDKPLQLGQVTRAVAILRKNDICVHCCIVLGLPGELEKHRDETMSMITRTGFDWSYFNLAVPVAGSRLYEICKENHYLVDEDFGGHNTGRGTIRTPDLDPAYMEERAYQMNLEANFVHNYNMKTGNFERASRYFRDVATTYPNHALAHYYLAKALEGFGDNTKEAEHHRQRFAELSKSDPTWARYASKYGLP